MPEMEAADRDAIYALLDRMRDNWARGDAVAYADCFTEDSDYITFNGIRLLGRKANAEIHAPLFRGVLKGTRLWFNIESLVFLAPHVVLVHTAGASARRKPDSLARKSVQTFVVVKQDGQWRIRAFQNTRVGRISAWVTRRMARVRSTAVGA